jgi:hypothetical protein
MADINYKKLGAKGLYVTPTYIGARQMAYLDVDDHLQDSMMTKYLTKAYTSNYLSRMERVKNETPEQMKGAQKKVLVQYFPSLHIFKTPA